MALAFAASAVGRDDAMDIDIDMDVDESHAGLGDEILEEGEEPSFVPTGVTSNTGEIPAIYLEDPAQEPTWEKIYIRGVDDMSTENIRVFATDHFPSAEPHVQWIDDTSANLVYKDKAVARQAILSFVSTPNVTSEDIVNTPLEMRQAKPLISHPHSNLIVRVAVIGDRKRKGAKDASRYYLMHPEADPTERMRREFAAGRPLRGSGENGDYRRRRFDEREHRRRRDHDHHNSNDNTTDFEASMYDDVPTTTTAEKDGTRGRDLFSRVTNSSGRRTRRRSASPNANGDSISVSDSEDDDDGRNRRRRQGYRERERERERDRGRDRDGPPPYTRRDPHPFPKTNAGKELFGDAMEDTVPTSQTPATSGGSIELFPSTGNNNIVSSLSQSPSTRQEQREAQHKSNVAAARRLKADLLASTTGSASGPSPRNHRRSHAIDSRVDEDLTERFGRKSISMDSTKSVTQPTANSGKELFGGNAVNPGGFSIKGSANQAQGMTIKGRADSQQAVKELFPEQYKNNRAGRGNTGKELFDQPVRSKGPRQRAGDLFD